VIALGISLAVIAAAAAIALGYVLGRRPRTSLDRHVDQALALGAPIDPSPDVYATLRIDLDDMDVALGIAELAVAWELPSYRPPREWPPVIPGPTRTSTGDSE
jgi:hypothetical protein